MWKHQETEWQTWMHGGCVGRRPTYWPEQFFVWLVKQLTQLIPSLIKADARALGAEPTQEDQADNMMALQSWECVQQANPRYVVLTVPRVPAPAGCSVGAQGWKRASYSLFL